jgi:hypothetical protein
MTAAVSPAANVYTGNAWSTNPAYNAVDGGVPRFKKGCVTLAATADAGDTTTFDFYALFGIVKPLIIRFFTDADGTVSENTLVTTAITGTQATVTIPTSSNDDARLIVVYGI